MPQRIVFAINSLTGGGAERVFTTLLGASGKYLQRYDASVVLLDDESVAYPLPEGIPVCRLDCGQKLRRSIGGLIALVKREKPDVIVSFLTRANVAAAIAMLLQRRPFIMSERVDTAAHLATGRFAWASRWLVRLTYSRATAIITVSEGVAETLVREFNVAPQRIKVIFNPIDVERVREFSRAPADIEMRQGDCVAMGRLVPNKNFALAVEAFARSEWEGRLILIGEGPLKDELRELGDRLGLGDRLVMPGFVENPFALLARSSMFILSSNAEGFPNALVEAMAVGTPAIATDCRSGPKEVLGCAIEEGKMAQGMGGFLVPPNDPETMAAAMNCLKQDSLRQSLGEAGHRRAAEFSVERAVRSYWQVIQDVVDRQTAS